MRTFVVFLCCLAIGVTAASCDGDGGTPSTSAIPSPVATSSTAQVASPTPPATPATAPQTSGASTATCAGGWTTPPKGPLWVTPLQVIRREADLAGPFVVVDMRTFVGGESPPTDKNYLKEIRRWYVKAYDPKDLTFQGRFLVEERRFGKGLAAVAPYDTHGFTSPDWVGFQYDAANRRRYRYAGLPGTWSGDAYDFVTGGRGLTFPGLPSEVAGCLDGT